MTITKNDLILFLQSFEDRHLMQCDLGNSLGELSEIIYRYWLFGRPLNYQLNENWEIKSALFMSKNKVYPGGEKLCDLMPYFLIFKRKDKIEYLTK